VGFREAGVRRGYYRNGDDALIQWVNLSLPDRCG
jgi:[ribosomal protein S18]-alanine N-acetyltransferase